MEEAHSDPVNKRIMSLERHIVLVLSYAATGVLGLQLAVSPGYSSPVFPAAGIAIAFVLYYGKRAAISVFIGAILLNIVQRIIQGMNPFEAVPLLVSVGIALASSLQSLVARFLLKTRISLPSYLAQGRELASITLVGGFLACLTSSTLSHFLLWSIGAVDNVDALTVSWLTWWTGDTLGVALFTPICLFFIQQETRYNSRRSLYILSPTVALFVFSIALYFVYLGVEAGHTEALRSIGVDDGIHPLLAWFTLALSLFSTSIVSSFIMVVTGQNDFVQREVQEKTSILQEVNQKLEEAVQSQVRFVSMASHELKTPFHTLNGYINLLRTTDPEEKLYLERVKEGCSQLGRLIDDIVEIAQDGSLNYRFENKEFRPKVLLETLFQEFEPRFLESGIDFQREVLTAGVGEDIVVVGDKLRVRQVIINLLSNALKFTKDGHIKLSLAMCGSSPDFIECRWAVSDTGGGLSDEEIEVIFTPFAQLESNRSITQTGMGLGLAIAQQLAAQMETKIYVRSEVGRGSEFRFVTGHSIVQEYESNEPVFAGEQESQLELGKQVLIADDHVLNAELLATYLVKFGYECTVVENGKDAIDCAAQRKFGLVLLDKNMDPVNGVEAAARIRETISGEARIVGLSASTSEVDRLECINAGMDAFLSKPFEEDELRVAIGDGDSGLSA